MNILHIIAQKPDSTGSGVFVSEMVKAYAAQGHNQWVIAGIGPEDAPIFPEGVRFRPVRFETEQLPFPVVGMSDEMPYQSTRYRDMTPEMVDAFKAAFSNALDDVQAEFSPDIVICHHLYLLTALVARRDFACPVTAISHSTDIRQISKIDLQRDYIRTGIAKLNRIFALHDQQALTITQVYGVAQSRIKVIGTGFNDQVFKQVEGLRQADVCNAVFAGKIWGKKGVRSLLSALDLLDFPQDGFTLRLAGGHGTQDEYESIVAQAGECRYPVTFLGKLPQEDLARIYNASDIFVLPSFFEGLPLVVVEALACGCKVVVSDLPGIRPWLEANAPGAAIYYVQPPRMIDTDVPEASDLPSFERNLAQAIMTCAAAQTTLENVRNLSSKLSWDALCKRILKSQK